MLSRHQTPPTASSRPRALRGFVVGLVTGILAAVLQLSWVAAPAQAGTATSDPAPADLLDPQVVASAPVHAAALRSIQTKAVDLVLAHHGLPATDRSAVLSWGRDEALAALWGLMVQAVETDPGQRTAEQQGVRDWLAMIARQRVFDQARATGEEYAKWVGLDLVRYRELSNTGTEEELHEFLKPPESIQPCGYVAPAPYTSERPTRTDTICDICVADNCVILCPYDSCTGMPSVEMFTRWGAAARYPTSGSNGLEENIATIGGAVESAYLELAAGASTTGTSSTAAPFVAGGRGLRLHAAASATAIPGGHLVDHAPQLLALAPWSHDKFADLAKRVIASDGAVLRGLVPGAEADQPMWPSWIAALVFRARVQKPAPEAMLQFAESQTALFSIFVGATLPRPLTGNGCDGTTLCSNTPAIPGATPSSGLQFVVKPQDVEQYVQTPSISVRYVDNRGVFGTLPSTTTRLSGRWFVQHLSRGQATADLQTLSLSYLDWEGHRNVVSLVTDAKRGYRFAGIKEVGGTNVPAADTCRSAYLCWTSDSIKYVGSDGRRYQAWVKPYQPPSGQPWYSSRAKAGTPVQFDANGFAPAYNNGGLTHQWRFQTDDCRGLCTTASGAPVYSAPVAGATSSYTWSAPGKHLVELSATDAAGQKVVTTLTVKVAPTPPVVTLPVCGPTVTGGSCSPRTWPDSRRVRLAGSIRTVGTDDFSKVVVDWGDGTPARTLQADADGSIPVVTDLVVDRDGPGAYVLSAGHDYSRTGTFTGSVTVTDIFGSSTKVAFTELVGAEQKITMAPIPPHTYGDRFTASATGGGSSSPVTFTASPASVCTASGINGRDITLTGVGTCTVTANQQGDLRYRDAAPLSSSFAVKPALLLITADDQSVASGDPVATDGWTASGWVNGEDATILTNAPTCRTASVLTEPGVYPGAIRCNGATAPNYSIGYPAGTLTVDPHVAMDVAGLPASLPHVGTADGHDVSLPLVERRVAFGSSHTYAFRGVVAEPSGLLHITTARGASGVVTANLDLVATYRTMDELNQAALAAGSITAKQGDWLRRQWAGVESDIQSSQLTEAATGIEKFVDYAAAVGGEGAPAAEVQALIDHALVVADHL